MPGYRKMFLDDPKDFFERYSINLPGNPEEAGKIGQLELMLSTMAPVKRAEGEEAAEITGTSAGKSFHKFEKKPHSLQVASLAHNAAWKVEEERRKATLIVRKSTASEVSGDIDSPDMEWFLCLMLPWFENGVTSMQIRRDTRATAFFTGQMNGCSFVVTGDPEAPFVSHINCADASEYEDTYRALLRDSGAKNKDAIRLGREQYKFTDVNHRLGHERPIHETLKMRNQKLTTDIVTDTLCFVMGRRVARKWEFFYQRVICQKYSYTAKLGRAGGLAKRFGRDNRAAHEQVIYRSINSYTKLWPNGSGRLST